MHCPECGTEIDDHSKFCMNCGKELTKLENNNKTTHTTESKQDSESDDNSNYKNTNGSTGTNSRRGIIALLGLAGLGVGGTGLWNLRKPEFVFQYKSKKSPGIIERSFTLNKKSYVDFDEEYAMSMVYSSSNNTIFYTNAVGLASVRFGDYAVDFPRPRSNVLPAGEYKIVSTRLSPAVKKSSIFFLRDTRTESASLQQALDYLEKKNVDTLTYVPTNRGSSYESYGYNLNEKITSLRPGYSNSRVVGNINRLNGVEAIVKTMIQKSDSRYKKRYRQIIRRNELWRSGFLTCYSIINSIDNLYDGLVSNILSEIKSTNRIPTNLFTKSINLLSGSNGSDYVNIGFYTTIPQYEAKKKVTVPVGINIAISASSPISSKNKNIYTPTVPIISAKTRDNSAPALGQNESVSMWEPAVSDIQSELMNKFTNSI